ncbi:DNA topoisomerase 3 [Caldisericum exile]|uniref:DNA topoisomerase n=1 Tax=Caldisericum exile (strain DSM 21853 / NBRC 104410 / AZM16c01) TaxID=511051 RepID=A0A7U6GFJ0_CALEA|nr:DNA topoisomerase 3 [Caldisericum exile]BAL81402.1 DNA topoisomerase III [Caldisericum exile AZM16c01]
MKTLIIAEKPTVARDIAKALGKFKDEKEYLENEEYVISWSLGHICELFEPEDYNKKLSFWTLQDLPIIPEEFKFKPKEDTKSRFNVLKKLILRKDIDTIVNACDAGREGELIFREILLLVNPKGKSLKRLWLSSMTKEEIVREFKNLRDASEFDNLGKASFAREEADWLVGINATRAFTRRWGDLLSLGRVQTPTLNILVSREKEIKSFVSEKYFELEGEFGKKTFVYSGTFIKDNETKFKKRELLENIANSIKGKNGIVESVEENIVKTPPPLLYDLTELQRDANKTFGFSAQRTLDIAQSLYEKRKLITYPRTDSRYLPSSLKSYIPQIIKSIKFEPYSYFAKEIQQMGINFTGRIINDKGVTDHYAIIPTGDFSNLKDLTKDEEKIFDLIMRRFLSVFYPYSETKKINLITKVEENRFVSSISFLIEPGFQKVYGKEKEDAISFKRGDLVLVKDLRILEKETQPPSRFTDATLLSAMENAGRLVEEDELKEALKEKGIGTPATRAQIIERLVEVGYVERMGKSLVPTEKGMRLIELVSQVKVEELLSPALTGEWEYKLLKIEKGKYDVDKFIEGIKELTINIVNKVKTYSGDYHIKTGSPDPVGICPKCGGSVYETVKGFTCENVEKGTCDFVIWKKLKNKTITRDMAEELLKGNRVKLKRVLSKGKKYFDAEIQLVDNKVSFIFEKPKEENITNEEPLGLCPKCGGSVYEKETVYACENYPDKCTFRIKKFMGGREITRDELKKLLQDHKTDLITDFVSSQGRNFKAYLVLENGSVKFEFDNKNAKNRSYRRKQK